MSKRWFTSDTHWFHKNIILYSRRPFLAPGDVYEKERISFDSISKMNEELIRRWNSVVQPNDDVFHLGDFFYGRYENHQADAVLSRLNGNIDLIFGNHDDKYIREHKRFRSADHMAEINVKDRQGKKHHLILCHYGMRVWHNSHRGSLHLYGHSHGTLPGNSQSLDVGADCWDYTPVGIDDILTRMRSLPPRQREFEETKYAKRV